MEDTLELIDDIYEASIRPGHWDRFFSKLCDRIAARSGCILVEDHDRNNRYILAAAGIPALVRLTYRMGLAKYDPIYKLQASRPVGEASMVARHEEMKTDNPLFYRFIMKPNDMGYLAAINLFNDEEWHVGIGIHRSFQGHPFGEKELSLLERLAPHMCRSLRIQRELHRQKDRAESLHASLGKLLLGVVILDADRRIQYRNAVAEAIVQKHPGLRLDGDTLRVHFPAEQRELDNLIAASLSGEADDRHLATGLRHPRRQHPLMVMLSPADANTDNTTPWARQGEVILYLSDPESALSVPADILHSLYGLTPAEANVAILLANGLSLAGIAEQKGVGIETVRSQLKSVFAKTGVRKQSELIGLLLRAGLQGY